MATRPRVLAIVPLCVVLLSCGDNKTTPTPTPTPTPTVTPAGQVSRIQATTPPTLTAVGEVVKLSLTAFYTNGTSRDVAAEAVWTIDMPSVVRVTNGEATALSFGATYLSARFDRFNTSIKIQVTPPGTFAILGGTREPGMSGLPGVSVTHPGSGFTTVTNSGGAFTLGGLIDRTLLVRKAGYEDATYTVEPEDFPWLAMQRLLRIQAGETIATRIAPHDMDYMPAYASDQGEHCSPCKLIRLSNTPGTRLRVTVKWTPTAVGVWLWTDDGTFAATSPGQIVLDLTSDSIETWLYVGQKPATAASQYLDVQVTVTKLEP